jgi:hypothetical protein
MYEFQSFQTINLVVVLSCSLSEKYGIVGLDLYHGGLEVIAAK